MGLEAAIFGIIYYCGGLLFERMNFYCFGTRDVRLLCIAISLLLLNFPIWWDINDIHTALGYSSKGSGDNSLQHAVLVLRTNGVLELQGGETVNTQQQVVRL